MKAKIILFLVLVILAAIIFIQNKDEVTYRVFFWKITISQMVLLPLIALVGFFIGYIAAIIITIKRNSGVPQKK